MIGVSRHDVMQKLAQTQITYHSPLTTYFVHGFDGMDEITLTNNSYLLAYENGKILEEEIINPEKFGFKKVGLETLMGADAKYNAEKLIALLNGEKSAYREIVILNSAFALKLAQRVIKIEEGVELAQSLIDSGKAKIVLQSSQQTNV